MRKLWLAVILFAVACSGATTSTPTQPLPQVSVVTVTSPPALPTATQPKAVTPLPQPAEPGKMTLTAADGASLVGLFYPPLTAPAPGVLLLHMLGGSKADWDAFARDLQRQGMAVLALDLRGHGESAKPEDWPKAPGDVRAAWDALIARREVDPKASAIVGASIGANLALIVGANNPDVVTVVALSPGEDYHGLQPSALLPNFGQRPVLLAASKDDSYSYTSAQKMTTLAPQGEAYYLANAGHGTRMFGDPNLKLALLDWLRKHLGILKG